MDLFNNLVRCNTTQISEEQITQEIINQVIEAARLAPTPLGLQAFKIISISNPELKSFISSSTYNQKSIVEHSHLLVFASWDKMTNEQKKERHEFMKQIRNQPEDIHLHVIKNLKNLFTRFNDEEQYYHSARQAYIGMGLAIAAASLLHINAVPVESFNKDALDHRLGLKKNGLQSITLLALGSKNLSCDWLMQIKKARVPKDDFTIHIQ